MSVQQASYLFGKRFPNRLFVGGLPANTTAEELAMYFNNFASVIEAKIISDENNIPKGYGFVTFQTEIDVKRVLEMGTLFLRNKKLNVGPAVRKEALPEPACAPELVVVLNQQFKGEYFYPAPAVYSQEYIAPPLYQWPGQPSCNCLYEMPYYSFMPNNACVPDQWIYAQPQMEKNVSEPRISKRFRAPRFKGAKAKKTNERSN